MSHHANMTGSTAPIERRTLLQAAAVGLIMPRGLAHAQAAPPEATVARRRVLRIAHLTDVHVQPEKRGGEGFAACLRHVHAQPDKPDLILFGGDNVMDVFARTRERASVQIDLWRRILAEECTIPFEVCVGNHDVWGWNKGESKTTGDEPLWGKRWALDAFELPALYRSFDRAGWRCIILDGTFPTGSGGYVAKLDDAQFAWLEETIDRTPAGTHVLIVSHMPILGAAVFFDGENEKSGDWVVPGSWMHQDARRLKDLFYRTGKVRACLSGHIHLVDRVEYLGVAYICSGAVSGAWWGGKFHECDAGYALVDLFDDGTVEASYTNFGWQPAT